MNDTSLNKLLACPRCDGSLDVADEGFRCAGCRVDFPHFACIPWLFADPGAALGEWRGRFNLALQKLGHDAGSYDAALQSADLHKLTRRRLQRLKAATEDHAHRLRTLLTPLGLGTAPASYETYLALRTRLPPDQGLTTYYPNLHRDWVWGETENEASLRLIREALGDALPGKTLVLGAGAGRLAYDIHMTAGPTVTVALDFNPLLALVARRVMAGETVELYEFPIAPANAEDNGILRRLEAPAPVREGFSFVLGDALRPPFLEQGFDTVVTPWLIDILPEDLRVYARRVNRLLGPGGRWINSGSLAFGLAAPALNYGLEECAAVLEDSGFASPAIIERTIPYICSPASRHARRETVVTWTATKTKNSKRPPRHRALPDWLVKGNDPVPLLPSFQAQATSTRIYAFIMSLIDGHRSLKEMARTMAEQRLMTREEAEPAIRSFLTKMYEDSQRESGY